MPTFTNVEIDNIIQNASFLAEMISYLGNRNTDHSNQTKKHATNELLLSSLRDKIYEEENIIKALLQNITKHQKEVRENTVSRTHFVRQLQQLKDKLEHTENTLNSLLSSLPLGIGLVRKDVFTYVNDQISRLTGYVPKELIGRNPELLFKNPADYYKICTDIDLALNTSSIETCLKRKDGTFTNVIIFVASINKGNPEQGIAFSFMDITTMQEYHRELLISKENK